MTNDTDNPMEKETQAAQVTPRLSVVIVNYNCAHLLPTCIASVRRYVAVAHEIIIVNNDHDDLSSLIDAARNISVIQSLENNGFSVACNRGAAAARGTTLCFLNPDAQLHSDVGAAITHIEKNSGIVGPALRDANGRTQPWSTGSEMTLGEIIRSNMGISRSRALWRSSAQRTVAWVSGAALFIDHALFKKIKGFDEHFFLYYEDVDLCRRARQEGAQVVYIPTITVMHAESGSMHDKKKQKQYYYTAQQYYFEKYYSTTIQKILSGLRRIIHPHYLP